MPWKSFQIVPRCDVQVAIVRYILSVEADESMKDNDAKMGQGPCSIAAVHYLLSGWVPTIHKL